MHHLVRRFTQRTGKMRSRLDLPPTPSSTGSTPSPPPHSAQSKGVVDFELSPTRRRASGVFQADLQHHTSSKQGVLDPQGYFYISWLCVVSMTFLYNAWVIPLRSTFPFQTPENTNTWLVTDFCADVVYLLDVIFIKHRIMYLHEGFWVRDKDLTRKNYMSKLQFKVNIVINHIVYLLFFLLNKNGKL